MKKLEMHNKKVILNSVLLFALAFTSYTTRADTQIKTVGTPIRFLLTFDYGVFASRVKQTFSCALDPFSSTE
ncbi:MAG: hypothetical protein EOO68_34855 [Moraxellaceae bacterium]|nr:MAG: hypothetical protein EOO68_34855 [Moraxellaceae bacterium]